MMSNGSNESLMHSLLRDIYGKVGSLEAMTLANRQAMTDRTELIRREVLTLMRAFKEEVFPRFLRNEAEYRQLVAATDERLRALEIAHGLSRKRRWTLVGAIYRALPLSRWAVIGIGALITACMHLVPGEMRALLMPVIEPVLQILKAATAS